MSNPIFGTHSFIREYYNVSFRWRNYADDHKIKIMTVDAFEFIRRFLLYVLPDRFVKISSCQKASIAV